ncbi:M23 family metallopeptidase [Sphingobacterium sp. DN00404]|uniref:M23 family metallopeptidase n=1 Tax=Sphingobacterium micropteri TaxID=2763501 RepID=A0ABR7YNI1_9SPHI|nr:M23 family metallopeptidase [Sphingobacterium micropteri]MBD1432852.1 M23 family metallopeptidase [Sphingobacterium micropteri]
MTSPKPTKCTIIIVDPEKGSSRSISIPALHLYNMRYYILIIAVVTGVLITACSVLYTSVGQQNEEREKLLSEINILQQQIPAPDDTLNARNYVERMEAKLSKISEYLQKRGVKSFVLDGAGGPEYKDLKLAPVEYYSVYDEYMEQLFEGLVYTPTGFPAKPKLTSNFGYRRNPFHGKTTEFHSGIDFRGNRGDKIRSTANGEVVFSGRNSGYGIYVLIRHQNGFETLYGHLSKALVKKGDKIAANQVIGEMGSTGRSTGPHLHYEVRKNGRPINPVDFLNLD